MVVKIENKQDREEWETSSQSLILTVKSPQFGKWFLFAFKWRVIQQISLAQRLEDTVFSYFNNSWNSASDGCE